MTVRVPAAPYIGVMSLAVLAVMSLGGCGEKPCNTAGSVKAEHGRVYHCVDRNDGNGLRWRE